MAQTIIISASALQSGNSKIAIKRTFPVVAYSSASCIGSSPTIAVSRLHAITPSPRPLATYNTIRKVDLNDNSSSIFLDNSCNFEPGRKRQRLTHLSADEKMNRRKLRNRIAAQTARDRKKVLMESMEDRLDRIERTNDKLEKQNGEFLARIRELEEENAKLKATALEKATSSSSQETNDNKATTFESAAFINVPLQKEQVVPELSKVTSTNPMWVHQKVRLSFSIVFHLASFFILACNSNVSADGIDTSLFAEFPMLEQLYLQRQSSTGATTVRSPETTSDASRLSKSPEEALTAAEDHSGRQYQTTPCGSKTTRPNYVVSLEIPLEEARKPGNSALLQGLGCTNLDLLMGNTDQNIDPIPNQDSQLLSGIHNLESILDDILQDPGSLEAMKSDLPAPLDTPDISCAPMNAPSFTVTQYTFPDDARSVTPREPAMASLEQDTLSVQTSISGSQFYEVPMSPSTSSDTLSTPSPSPNMVFDIGSDHDFILDDAKAEPFDLNGDFLMDDNGSNWEDAFTELFPLLT